MSTSISVLSLMSSQIKPTSVVLKGHRESVNLIQLNADLSMLLSGGMPFVSFPLHLEAEPMA